MAASSAGCDICQENISKYRCPRCQIRSCCLSCINKHKSQTGCDGLRDKTAFVSLTDFNECHLLSDYRFLEEVDRCTFTIHRDKLKQRRSRPHYVKKLVGAASKRYIYLDILPWSFSRRKENSSYFNFKKKAIYWHVEWVFTELGVKFTDVKISGRTVLKEMLKKYLDPLVSEHEVQQKLKPFIKIGIDHIKVLLKDEKSPSNSIKFYDLDINKSINRNLVNKVIIEYPTLYVVLSEHLFKYTIKVCRGPGPTVILDDDSEPESKSLKITNEAEIVEVAEEPETEATELPISDDEWL